MTALTRKSRIIRLRNYKRTSVENRTNCSTRKTAKNRRPLKKENANDEASTDGNNDAVYVAATEGSSKEIEVASVGTAESATTDDNLDNNEIVNVHNNENTNVDNNERDGAGDDEDNKENDEMLEEIDSIHTAMVDFFGKPFPSSDEYEYIDIAGDPDFYGHAPWFDRYAVLTEGLLDEFVEDERWMPCWILLATTRTSC